MDLLGQNSLEVLRKLEQRNSSERYYGFPLASIVAIAVKLVCENFYLLVQIESLRQLHEVGFLHSDVKPNNVVLDSYSDWSDLFLVVPTPGSNGSSSVSINDNSHVSLVDFGLSEKYIDTSHGQWTHISFEKINRTLGNKFFMSLNQLKKYCKLFLLRNFSI